MENCPDMVGLANSVGHEPTEDQIGVLTDMIWVTGNNIGYYMYHVSIGLIRVLCYSVPQQAYCVSVTNHIDG